ncbi:MAG TPA: hypothetical protein VGA73_04305 [Candidatus Binatia bacterium]
MRAHTTAKYSPHRKPWRIVHVLCMALVFSYIVFDILDLDGSDLPTILAPAEWDVISAEMPADLDQAERLDRADLWNDTLLFPDLSAGRARFHDAARPPSSPLDSARAHGYRTGLPRDAITH